jgi:Holliday junction resolvase RusA-like endonuclease
MERVAFTIHGQMASKSNRRRLVVMGEHVRSIKSEEALAFVAGALPQIPSWARRRFEGPVRVRVRVFYRNRQSDLDEQLVLDVLQDQWALLRGKRLLTQGGVYRNDNQIVERHAYKAIDARRPRVEVVVWALQQQQETLL